MRATRAVCPNTNTALSAVKCQLYRTVRLHTDYSPVGTTGKAPAVVFFRLFFAQLFYVGVELGHSYSETNKG